MSATSSSSSWKHTQRLEKKLKQSSFTGSEASRQEAKQDVYQIQVSYAPRPQTNLKQAKYFKTESDLQVLERAIILLQKSGLEDPNEEVLRAKIDEVCQMIVTVEVRAALKEAKEEQDKHSRLVTDYELKIKQLQDKLNS